MECGGKTDVETLPKGVVKPHAVHPKAQEYIYK